MKTQSLFNRIARALIYKRPQDGTPEAEAFHAGFDAAQKDAKNPFAKGSDLHYHWRMGNWYGGDLDRAL